MVRMSSFFVVEFTDTNEEKEPYFYWGPSMDNEEWNIYINRLWTKAERQLKKEVGDYSLTAFKFRLDKLLKERGFYRHTVNVASMQEDSLIVGDVLISELDRLVIR